MEALACDLRGAVDDGPDLPDGRAPRFTLKRIAKTTGRRCPRASRALAEHGEREPAEQHQRSGRSQLRPSLS
jgi:hypothetical protein